MKILLLGATGRTGQLILQILLERNYSVRIIVRRESRVKCQSERLEVMVYDTFSEGNLTKAARGCQAIISALNISRTSDFPWSRLRTPVKFLSDTMTVILRTAKRLHIDRVIICSAWGVHETKADIPCWFRWLIDHSNIGAAYAEHENQENLLKSSDLNYTIVRPVALINLHMKIPTLVTENNIPKPNLIISRIAVAQFMADQLASHKYSRNVITISQKRYQYSG